VLVQDGVEVPGAFAPGGELAILADVLDRGHESGGALFIGELDLVAA